MQRLADKVAIITGAAGGIGAATARRFVAEGARVMLADRDEGGLTRIAGEVTRAAGREGIVATRAIDVGDEAATKSMIEETLRRFGGLDVYFANAGMEGRVAPLTEVGLDELRHILGINVGGVFLGLKHAAEPLAARHGSFIATSSIAGLIGSPGLGPYIASKHAVLGLVKTAAWELGPRGVRVNAISPGPIDNRMMRSIEEQAAPGTPSAVRAGFTSKVPLGRYGRNEEIAAAALFLASDDGAYCNGTTIVCDGGFVAG